MKIDYEKILEKALAGCKRGIVTDELKTLYQIPHRDRVPWGLFPNWARIDFQTEGCHEG